MNNNNFEVYFDCGFSRIRVGAFNKDDLEKNIYNQSEFLIDHSNVDFEIQKIISFLEDNSKEYLEDVSLMIDSPKMLPIGISIAKRLDGSKLKKEDIQFLVQDCKQQILRNYSNYEIAHIIINNYKIDNIEYTFLPNDLICNLVSLDIFFICIPKETVEYFKKLFLKLNISVKQVFCTSYAKFFDYKDNFPLEKNLSLIDIGFNKTSIIHYKNNKIIFFNVLPVGSNHITKDLSKVLNINLINAEKIKLRFSGVQDILDIKEPPPDLIDSIITTRIEEILKLYKDFLELNNTSDQLKKIKTILMGDGSKILHAQFKEKISFPYEIELQQENPESICQSALKLSNGANKQEVVMIPKKQIKLGFFENLFHFFR